MKMLVFPFFMKERNGILNWGGEKVLLDTLDVQIRVIGRDSDHQ